MNVCVKHEAPNDRTRKIREMTVDRWRHLEENGPDEEAIEDMQRKLREKEKER